MKKNERMLKWMSFGDVLDYSIEIYKRNFKKLSILALIFYLPVQVLMVIGIDFLGKDAKSAIGSGYLEGAYYFLIFMLIFLWLGYYITMKVIVDAAAIRMIFSDMAYSVQMDIKTALKEAFKKTFRLIGNKILFYLILGGFSGVVLILFTYLAGVLLTASGLILLSISTMVAAEGILGILLAIMVLLVYALAVLPMGFAYVKFGFGTHAIAIENRGSGQAISRSVELTNGSFWHSFFAVFFGGLLYAGMPILLVSATQLIQFIDSGFYENFHLLTDILTQIFYTMLYPFLLTLMTVLFVSLKIRREGFDLELKVDQLLYEKEKDESSAKFNV